MHCHWGAQYYYVFCTLRFFLDLSSWWQPVLTSGIKENWNLSGFPGLGLTAPSQPSACFSYSLPSLCLHTVSSENPKCPRAQPSKPARGAHGWMGLNQEDNLWQKLYIKSEQLQKIKTLWHMSKRALFSSGTIHEDYGSTWRGMPYYNLPGKPGSPFTRTQNLLPYCTSRPEAHTNTWSTN